MHGFFDGFSRQATISCYTCVLFRFFFFVLLLCAWFFDWFRRQATIIWYMFSFLVFLCVFDAMRVAFFIGYADRHPLVAICVVYLFLSVFVVLCAWVF